MSSLLHFLFLLIAIPLLVYGFRLNTGLYYQPNIVNSKKGHYNKDVLKQLRYIQHKLEGGGGEEMQRLYPEGYCFSYALYGLSWCNFLEDVDKTDTLFREGIHQIDWAISLTDSEKGRGIFSRHVPLTYGAFYNGWLSYLIGKRLELENDAKLAERFQILCEGMVDAYETRDALYLESYPSAIWPADNMLCVAAIDLHDKLFSPQYQSFLKQWLNRLKNNLDTTTGLIPHSVANEKGIVRQTARGSSQSLMLSLMPAIDSAFAKDQFAKYRAKFVDYRLGRPGIREHPKGIKGKGDIDSGPVIWDIGGSASIVGIRATALNGDWGLSRAIRNSVEGFGIPITIKKEKRYLFGKLLMADIFIAWANSTYTQKQLMKQEGTGWIIHLLSLLTLFILLLFYRLIFRRGPVRIGVLKRNARMQLEC